MTERRSGDFTGLAGDYARHRPDYSASVLSGLIGLLERPFGTLDVADLGAGTGIWTRMVSGRGPRSLVAVEPNADMRSAGEAAAADLPIRWLEGRAEATSLPHGSVDWITMASSFHWVDFGAGVREFHRLLRPGGRFTALWNPRRIEASPLLVEIDEMQKSLAPEIKRVSSGRAGVTDTLSDDLEACGCFEDVIYLEGRHTIVMTPERYLGAWRSVNDVRVQMGPERFETFLERVEDRLRGVDAVEAPYLTRAWSARRRD